MFTSSRIQFLLCAALASALASSASRQAHAADRLAEFLFWNEMGKAAGSAARSHAEYQQERQLWREKIATAKEELKRCGGCAGAKAELEKWQGTESRFQEIAGGLAQSVGMPPIIAQWLDIRLPMTSGVASDHQEGCQVVKPDWVDDSPEFCQAAADAYLTCLDEDIHSNRTCSKTKAFSVGGQCWQLQKQFNYCATGDYDAFKREQKVLDLRAAGTIVPEYVDDGVVSYISYGTVPDEFVPEVPPSDVIEDELAKKSKRTIEFVMRREKRGQLEAMRIEHFSWQDAGQSLFDQCKEPEVQGNEIRRRICEDAFKMRALFKGLVLTCDYQGGAWQRYWFDRRPESADPVNLLKRARDHPFLRLGEPRTSCPVSLDEANRISSDHEFKVRDLALRIPQIPSDVVPERTERELKILNETPKHKPCPIMQTYCW